MAKKTNNQPPKQQAPAQIEEELLDDAFGDDEEVEQPQTETTTDNETAPPVVPKQEGKPVDPSIFDADLTPEQRLSYNSSIVDGKVYEFPYNDASNTRINLTLASQMIPSNLKKGQVLTLNAQMHTFLFMNEIGVNLSIDNPKITLEADPDQALGEYLVQKIQSGALWLGDFNLKKRQVVVAVSTLDCKQFLDKSIKILREDLKDITSKQTFVDKTGQISSPAVDLKALLNYEQKNNGRKDYLDLLRRALSKIHGSVRFLDQMTEVKTLEERAKETMPTSEPADNPSAVNNFM